MDVIIKKRMSVLAINDETNLSNNCLSNMASMCCSSKVMDQHEIITKTNEAYGLVAQ